MTYEIRVLFLVALCIVLVIISIPFVKAALGRPSRGVLHVPQGRNIIDVTVCNKDALGSYRFAQTFETVVMPGTQTMTDVRSGMEQSGRGALSKKGKPIGFVDPSSPFVPALDKLAESHPKVMVRAVVLSVESDGHPVMRVKLPDTSWFKRALQALELERKLK